MSKNTNLSFLTDYITADITNGRIGINTPSPTVALDVTGATKITGVLTLTSTISNGTYAYTLPSATGTLALTSALSGTTNYVAKFTSSSAIGNSSIFDNGTSVGIGTSSPASNLDIISGTSGFRFFANGTTYAQMNLLADLGSGLDNAGAIAGVKESTNNAYLSFSTKIAGSLTEKMRINSAGNVGIGTSSPTSISTFTTLEIRGANGGGIKIGKTSVAQFNIQHDGTDAYFNNTANGALYIYTNDTERMRITSGGEIVCTTHVKAISYGLTQDGSFRGGLFTYKGISGGGTDYGTTIFAEGGTGNGNIYFCPGGSATIRMTISTTGNIGAPSGTNIYNASDARLKKNISTTTYGLDAIAALNPVKFNWVDGFEPSEDGKDLLGFVAQEVQTIIPEAVELFGGNSIIVGDTVIDNPLRVNEKFIIPILVKAIQELSAKVSLLENK